MVLKINLQGVTLNAIEGLNYFDLTPIDFSDEMVEGLKPQCHFEP